ncbi:hypothetical protein TL16_g09367 [Triparma laevis f. inornata]|uniref:Uncharacterized protein n=2 Tax=Triparma laevis TaxID=1534972 RepID=A0A9W7A0W7_9STRA|nr:hypothetical protein TrLO_g2201 [Triparma laevis f. longispina]GMH82747.1 hypothetical protein TL16_g09367 [Triparma laevis f. inornata]
MAPTNQPDTSSLEKKISSCSGFTYYTPNPPTYSCFGVRSSITKKTSSPLPKPPRNSKSLCAGYAVFQDGGGAICGLGMQFVVGSKTQTIDKNAIMEQNIRDQPGDGARKIRELMAREMAGDQNQDGLAPREKKLNEKVKEKVQKQVDSHHKYAEKLAQDIGKSLSNEFPQRMGKAAGRLWDRKGKTIEEIQRGADKIFWGKGGTE